jgi:Tol biopolymer transport system component
MMLTLEKDHRVQPLIQTPASERNAEISPDGRWLAYESNDSGQFQIFVRPFPNVNTGLWQVSTGGGTQPLWAKKGHELFYLASDGALMSVRVETMMCRSMARVFKDGGGPNQSSAPPSIVVVQNWTEELKRLVPTQ